MIYNKQKIQDFIFSAIDIFNEGQLQDVQLEKNLKESLFGRAGYTKSSKLDSLTLIYFLVQVEEYFQKEDPNFNLQTTELLEAKETHLQDVSTFIQYISNLPK